VLLECVFACDLIHVVTGPGSGTCRPLACLCCSLWGTPRSWLHPHVLTPGALGHALAHCAWLSGVPGPLGYWVGLLPGGLGALGILGPGSGALPMFGWLGPGGVCGLLPWLPGGLCLWGLCPGPLQSSGWMRGCPRPGLLYSVGAAGGLGLVALSACV